MTDYAANVAVRLDHAHTFELQLELLTYAEGELLRIHPFADFNGRTARVVIADLLVRLDLPPINPSVNPQSEEFRRYRDALANYDNASPQALLGLWSERLGGAGGPPTSQSPMPS
jgi:CRISPR-associated endonuclease/helicase Cas3